MEKVITCPNCLSKDIKLVLKSKDYFLTKEAFDIDKCATCYVYFTNPKPTKENLLNYYKSASYISHGVKSFSLVNTLYKISRSLTLKWKINILNQLTSKGPLLDYGCGTGDFLKSAKINGWTIDGIEPSDLAREKAEKNTNQKILISLEQVRLKKYNIISLWHVLEHVSDLENILERLKELLHEEGRLIIAVPNHESYDAQKFGEYWAGYDLPRHLWHFDTKSLPHILNKVSLKVDRIIPMKLDAYYISLISNNYKLGSSFFNLFRAINDGLKSNKRAKKENNYSSLIYIVKSV